MKQSIYKSNPTLEIALTTLERMGGFNKNLFDVHVHELHVIRQII